MSALDTRETHRTLDVVPLGNLARPNHLEFVQNPKGKAIYVSLVYVRPGAKSQSA